MSADAERALVGRLLTWPGDIAEALTALTVAEDFADAGYRFVFERILDAWYADEPMNAVLLSPHVPKLSRLWGVTEPDAVERLKAMQAESYPPAVPLVAVVKRAAAFRGLERIVRDGARAVEAKDRDPDAIAGELAAGLSAVAAGGSERVSQLISYEDIGRDFYAGMRQAEADRKAGIKGGCWFDLRFIDEYLRGLQPGELWVLAGEPGSGKSAVAWHAARNYAKREMTFPENERVGVLIVSLEMTLRPSSQRFGSMIGGIDASKIRAGEVDEGELRTTMDRWVEERNLPVWLNVAPNLRASQLRALIAEAVLRHNAGLVVIDHFRMFDLDKRLQNRNDEDEEKIRFISEEIAQSLNTAVICLTHTRKQPSGSSGRPDMNDLRGSGQIAAHSDFVSFIFRPWMYATDAERDSGDVKQTDADMIWSKNRHGQVGTERFYFNGAKMFVAD